MSLSSRSGDSLPRHARNPIVATAGAVLQNLRLKLGPFLRCYLRDTPASRRLYAVSELQFWLASTNQAVRALDLFTHNLDDQ